MPSSPQPRPHTIGMGTKKRKTGDRPGLMCLSMHFAFHPKPRHFKKGEKTRGGDEEEEFSPPRNRRCPPTHATSFIAKVITFFYAFSVGVSAFCQPEWASGFTLLLFCVCTPASVASGVDKTEWMDGTGDAIVRAESQACIGPGAKLNETKKRTITTGAGFFPLLHAQGHVALQRKNKIFFQV